MHQFDIELVTYSSQEDRDISESDHDQVTTNFSSSSTEGIEEDFFEELTFDEWVVPFKSQNAGRKCEKVGDFEEVSDDVPSSDPKVNDYEEVTDQVKEDSDAAAKEDKLTDQGLSRACYLLSLNHQVYAKGLNNMTLNRGVQGSSFTSYIDLQPSPYVEKEQPVPIEPDLLAGEMVISQAERVCCYITNAGGTTSGHTGTLFVTTLKLSYRPNVQGREKRENKLLDRMDLSLSSIHSVFELIGENGEKRKRLPLGTNVSHKVDGIFVLCKNFKFLRLSFKFSGVDAGRNITNTLLHHSRPKKNELLFAFEHSRNSTVPKQMTTNWDKILSDSDCPNMRLCRANESWQVSNSLPQQFVVPSHVTDKLVSQVAGLGLGTRPPVWVWGHRGGGAIFVQPALNVLPSSEVDSLYEEFYDKPNRQLIMLDQSLPSIQGLHEGFSSLLDLHTAENEKDLEERDMKYFSSLEGTGWPTTIGSVLRIAAEVAEQVVSGKTVVLVEGEGRSSSLLVSSLARLLLCEESRTRTGFETLVQSNWVSLGFPFCKAHALSGGSAVGGIQPLFLLFLDCVHQIGVQFPSKLEFLPSYLMALWDTALLPVFDTFIFDSEHDRALARTERENPLQLHSAWEWSQQFSRQKVEGWVNPLFGVPLRPPRSSTLDPAPSSMIMCRELLPIFPESKKFLNVSCDTASLSPWFQLFHRSVPTLQIAENWSKSLYKVRIDAKTQVSSVMSSTHQHRIGSGVNNKNHHKTKQWEGMR